VVERDNIVVDGAGYTVQGMGASYSGGISLSGRGNVTIKNTNVRKFDYGIYLHSSIDCKVENVTASDNGYGIGLLWESNQNILSHNNATNNSYGIYVYNSNNNNITSNTITRRTAWGIYLYDSSNNSLSGNVVSSGMNGILLLGGGPGNILSGNVVSSNVEGIVLTDANNNTVSGNVVSSNGRYGITLMGDNNIIYGNTIVNNSVSGIYIQFHSNNTISNNTITSNECGVSLWTVPNNNRIFGNSIMNNEIGIQLWDSSNNSIYHNNFVNNAEQVYIYPSAISVNTWDDGYPSGGNYWSDYNGTDANHDGIGDTPYIIDANNTDYYPLMVQYVIPEFPSFLILPLFFIATLLAVIVHRKRGIKNRKTSSD
jgi:parallel beta-helix repeat protein